MTARPIAGAILLAVGLVTVSAARAHDPSMRMRAFGSASVDGVLGAGEWDAAARWSFAANVPGGGTTPGILMEMNDGDELFLAVKVDRPTLGSSSVNFVFDNDHDGTLHEEGDESLLLNPSGGDGFYDEYVTLQPPCPTGAVCLGILDAQVGGTNDGRGLATNNGSFSFYEISHPLDTTDNAHDFSLRLGRRVGFSMSLRFCTTSCADTDSSSFGDIVVTSTSSLPPETLIAEGPVAGASTGKLPAVFRFSGSDDVIDPADLLFECRIDDRPFEPCTSPSELAPQDGPHTFAVRAVDEVGNVDASPATRAWIVDTTPPTRPRVIGPRVVKKRLAVYRLSASDAVDSPRQLRFRCKLDRRAIACGVRATLRLSVGRHVFSAAAVDRAGNAGSASTVRIVRKAPSKRRR